MSEEPDTSPRKAWRPRYLVRNWPEYDRALARRGDVTVWVSEAAFFHHKRVMGDSLRGQSLPAQRTKAKIAIEAVSRMAELGMPVTERAV